MTTLTVEGVAHGGDGVGRSDGKAVFVLGALPGDVVRVDVVEHKRKFDRAVVAEIVEPSPDRVDPPCGHFGRCGGCQWQMAAYPAQLRYKHDIVASQLRHLGRIDVEVRPTLAVGPPVGYRNRMDFRLVDGRPSLNQSKSHEPVAISECLLLVGSLQSAFARLEPLVGELVTLRAGVNTGDTLTLLDDDHGKIHESVAGVDFVITDRAFFQVNTAGAAALVDLVADILRPGDSDVLLDAYAGGGLFSATVGQSAGRVISVESAPTSVADLRANVPVAEIVPDRVERALGALDPVDVAVVDPPRQGLGQSVVSDLVALRPRAIAAVSCDPASFARDARLFVDAGYALEWAQPVDMFPQTFHVEVVGSFTRLSG